MTVGSRNECVLFVPSQEFLSQNTLSNDTPSPNRL